jgi:hypothetical protein
MGPMNVVGRGALQELRNYPSISAPTERGTP